ncbi:RNA12 protein-domain-containing protein [Blyttiomyces helicus]|uniref:Mitochondrial escape protein 2 n=1 Tax=Blyttiomyces helicus TaxID=388810 RepID=A0A4P9WAQ4_9FUNG|nr:RNA12 protein-domain-containing protein [Blyttiomyces helicus]|eukprot:RKO88238.1 RNA12 protein-domain-containing protein [Blyttiomyces helicus]
MGEDTKEAGYSWTPIQMWKVIQMLAANDEVSYDHLRMHPLFKGDDLPLQQMERTGLILLHRDLSRPVTLHAGKPVYRTAFERIATDARLAAVMGILTNKQLVADEEKRIRDMEEEMALIARFGGGKEVAGRVVYLGKRIAEGSDKVVGWQEEIKKFGKVLA